jgi:hypothetical protein
MAKHKHTKGDMIEVGIYIGRRCSCEYWTIPFGTGFWFYPTSKRNKEFLGSFHGADNPLK